MSFSVRARLANLGPPFLDGLVAVAVAAFAQVEIWAGDLPNKAALSPVALLMVALAWRRRAPVAVAVTVIWTLTLMTLIEPASDELIIFLVAAILAMYSLGAHAPLRRSIYGFLASLAGVYISIFGTGDTSVGDFLNNLLFGVIMIGVAWGLGILVKGRTTYATQQEERAEVLERTQEERIREATEDERARIARELHDIIAHSLSVMVVQAGAAEEIFETDPRRALTSLASIRESGQRALLEMRGLLGLLRKGDAEPTLTPQPDLNDIESLVHKINRSGIAMDLRVKGHRRPLPRGLELSVYRIAQEALTNVLKHANARSGSIVLRYERDHVWLEVLDDGSGAREEAASGHGLIGMRERVAVYGGTLEAGNRPEGGFRIRAMFPMNGELP